jgi:predicted XRE-type DNA-binding protein
MNAAHSTDTIERNEIPYTVSSGNVFADLGVDESAEALLKADLARHIGRIIRERGLTQIEAAKVLGVDQPKVSALLRGRLTGFSIDRLVRYAAALDQEVEVVVRARGHGSDHTSQQRADALILSRSLR